MGWRLEGVERQGGAKSSWEGCGQASVQEIEDIQHLDRVSS